MKIKNECFLGIFILCFLWVLTKCLTKTKGLHFDYQIKKSKVRATRSWYEIYQYFDFDVFQFVRVRWGWRRQFICGANHQGC